MGGGGGGGGGWPGGGGGWPGGGGGVAWWGGGVAWWGGGLWPGGGGGVWPGGGVCGLVGGGVAWWGGVWPVVVVVVRAPSTCRREKLPDTLSLGRAQGSSRPASRWPGVCRQRPRGGGGGVPPSVWGGGGGACRCERDHLPMRPWFPPPPWGEGVRTCAKWRRDGGRDGGTTCPGTCRAPVPLASSRHSPATGEGATSCAEVE